jgi:hypothetical protein
MLVGEFWSTMESVATPVVSTSAVPRVLPPALNVTLPVGVAGPVQRTTEIRVTCWTPATPVELAVRIVAVGRSCTSCEKTGEADGKLVLSPA